MSQGRFNAGREAFPFTISHSLWPDKGWLLIIFSQSVHIFKSPVRSKHVSSAQLHFRELFHLRQQFLSIPPQPPSQQSPVPPRPPQAPWCAQSGCSLSLGSLCFGSSCSCASPGWNTSCSTCCLRSASSTPWSGGAPRVRGCSLGSRDARPPFDTIPLPACIPLPPASRTAARRTRGVLLGTAEHCGLPFASLQALYPKPAGERRRASPGCGDGTLPRTYGAVPLLPAVRLNPAPDYRPLCAAASSEESDGVSTSAPLNVER